MIVKIYLIYGVIFLIHRVSVHEDYERDVCLLPYCCFHPLSLMFKGIYGCSTVECLMDGTMKTTSNNCVFNDKLEKMQYCREIIAKFLVDLTFTTGMPDHVNCIFLNRSARYIYICC